MMRHLTRRPTAEATTDRLLVTIESVNRLRPTRAGNPRWQVVTRNAGTFVTQPDAAVAHHIDEFDPTRHNLTPDTVTVLHLNEARRIVAATSQTGADA